MLRAMSEDDKPHKWSDWSEQKPHTLTQERLLDFLILVAPNQLARAAVEFEVQRRLAQRQLEAAEGPAQADQRAALGDVGARGSHRRAGHSHRPPAPASLNSHRRTGTTLARRYLCAT